MHDRSRDIPVLVSGVQQQSMRLPPLTAPRYSGCTGKPAVGTSCPVMTFKVMPCNVDKESQNDMVSCLLGTKHCCKHVLGTARAFAGTDPLLPPLIAHQCRHTPPQMYTHCLSCVCIENAHLCKLHSTDTHTPCAYKASNGTQTASLPGYVVQRELHLHNPAATAH